MNFNKDEIKNNLSLDQIESLVAELGGEPRRQGNILICRTICHSGNSHKLYYYDNTKLFKCYTECNSTFDIFELLIKIHKLEHEEWTLYNAMSFVINYFSLNFEEIFSDSHNQLQDWDFLNKWEKINNENALQKKVELKVFDDSFLKHLPQPRILSWEREGIKKEVCDARGIRYNPASHGIVIPHYNINNELIGIRERTLIKENEQYGKYLPSVLNGVMYNHPLGFNLYNLNYSKENIKRTKKAFLFEGEKSPLLYSSIFGLDNDITAACCGNNFIFYQFSLLYSLGVEEIIISFDRQYQEIGDDEWKKWTQKLKNIHTKYNKYVQISFLFDKEHLLDYKDSPIDKGKDVFLYLYNNRVFL